MAKYSSHPDFDPIQSILIACSKARSPAQFLYRNTKGVFFIYSPGVSNGAIETISEQEAKMRYPTFQDKPVPFSQAFPDKETSSKMRIQLKELEALSSGLSVESPGEDLIKIIKLQSKFARAVFEHLKALEDL